MYHRCRNVYRKDDTIRVFSDDFSDINVGERMGLRTSIVDPIFLPYHPPCCYRRNHPDGSMRSTLFMTIPPRKQVPLTLQRNCSPRWSTINTTKGRIMRWGLLLCHRKSDPTLQEVEEEENGRQRPTPLLSPALEWILPVRFASFHFRHVIPPLACQSTSAMTWATSSSLSRIDTGCGSSPRRMMFTSSRVGGQKKEPHDGEMKNEHTTALSLKRYGGPLNSVKPENEETENPQERRMENERTASSYRRAEAMLGNLEESTEKNASKSKRKRAPRKSNTNTTKNRDLEDHSSNGAPQKDTRSKRKASTIKKEVTPVMTNPPKTSRTESPASVEEREADRSCSAAVKYPVNRTPSTTPLSVKEKVPKEKKNTTTPRKEKTTARKKKAKGGPGADEKSSNSVSPLAKDAQEEPRTASFASVSFFSSGASPVSVKPPMQKEAQHHEEKEQHEKNEEEAAPMCGREVGSFHTAEVSSAPYSIVSRKGEGKHMKGDEGESQETLKHREKNEEEGREGEKKSKAIPSASPPTKLFRRRHYRWVDIHRILRDIRQRERNSHSSRRNEGQEGEASVTEGKGRHVSQSRETPRREEGEEDVEEKKVEEGFQFASPSPGFSRLIRQRPPRPPRSPSSSWKGNSGGYRRGGDHEGPSRRSVTHSGTYDPSAQRCYRYPQKKTFSTSQ